MRNKNNFFFKSFQLEIFMSKFFILHALKKKFCLFWSYFSSYSRWLGLSLRNEIDFDIIFVTYIYFHLLPNWFVGIFFYNHHYLDVFLFTMITCTVKETWFTSMVKSVIRAIHMMHHGHETKKKKIKRK